MSHAGKELAIRNLGRGCILPLLPPITLHDACGRALPAIRAAPPGMHPGPVMIPALLGGGLRATIDLRWVSGPVFTHNRSVHAAYVVVRIGTRTLRAPLRAVLYGEGGKPVMFDQMPARTAEVPAAG